MFFTVETLLDDPALLKALLLQYQNKEQRSEVRIKKTGSTGL